MHNTKCTEVGRVSVISLLVTLLLTVMKLTAGLLCASEALTSDGVHSFFDVICDSVVLLGVQLSLMPEDDRYPRGRGRLEYIASAMLAAMLAAAAVVIAASGISSLGSETAAETERSIYAIIAAVISIGAKTALWRITAHTARVKGSVALKACSRHHLADIFATLCALLGILGTLADVHMLEPLASIAISLFMFHASAGIFRDAVLGLADRACSDGIQTAVKQLIFLHPAVLSIERLVCCHSGGGISIDASITLPGGTTLAQAEHTHRLLENAVRAEFGPQSRLALSIGEDEKNRGAAM